jgi:hypothetical protein
VFVAQYINTAAPEQLYRPVPLFNNGRQLADNWTTGSFVKKKKINFYKDKRKKMAFDFI